MIDEIPEREHLPKSTHALSLSRFVTVSALICVTLLVMLLCSRGLDWIGGLIWPTPTSTQVELSVPQTSQPAQVAQTPLIQPLPQQAASVRPEHHRKSLPEQSTATSISTHTSPQEGQSVASSVSKPAVNSIPSVQNRAATDTREFKTDVSEADDHDLTTERNPQAVSASQTSASPEQKELPAHTAKVLAPTTAVQLNFLKSEKEILQVKPEHYAIQILALHSKEKLLAFIEQAKLQGKSRYYVAQFQGKPWYVLIYGDYKTRAEAQAALVGLSEVVKQEKPWVRSYASLQGTIRARQ